MSACLTARLSRVVRGQCSKMWSRKRHRRDSSFLRVWRWSFFCFCAGPTGRQPASPTMSAVTLTWLRWIAGKKRAGIWSARSSAWGVKSRLHVYQALYKSGKNAFYDPKAKYRLSDLGLSYIAGLLEHARGMAVITNPLVNSYKRLV